MRKAIIPIVFTITTAAISANAQGFYQTGSGTFMTGYGQVHGSFGYALATQRMYESMQMNMQKAMWRAAMVKKHGEAAVRRAEARARTNSSSGSSAGLQTIEVPPPPPTPKYNGRFRPAATSPMTQKIVDALGDTAEEKALLKQIIQNTKAAFEKEATAKGWNNNIAGAVTFFLVASSTVYHDSAEPSEETVKTIYDSVNQSIDSIPDFATASNADKQATYDLFIGFAAIPFATYMEGKQNNSPETVEVSRKLAGELIKMLLKADPDKVKF